MQIVKVPSVRVKHLMGGAKAEIEKQCGISLKISQEGDVEITSKDPVSEWRAVDVIKAIGRGFRPSTALKLIDEEYSLKIINLKDIFDSEKQRSRYKARVIGTKGKAKSFIEAISGATICVYGNTISIIGRINEIALAEKGVGAILEGMSHGTVFHMLQKEKRKMGE